MKTHRLFGVCAARDCDQLFLPGALSAKYCRPACSKRERSRRLSAQAGPRPERSCGDCRALTVSGERAQCAGCLIAFTQGERSRRFCCKKCRDRTRLRNQRSKTSWTPQVRACRICRRGFWAMRPQQRFCKPGHRTLAWTRQQRRM